MWSSFVSVSTYCVFYLFLTWNVSLKINLFGYSFFFFLILWGVAVLGYQRCVMFQITPWGCSFEWLYWFFHSDLQVYECLNVASSGCCVRVGGCVGWVGARTDLLPLVGGGEESHLPAGFRLAVHLLLQGVLVLGQSARRRPQHTGVLPATMTG